MADPTAPTYPAWLRYAAVVVMIVAGLASAAIGLRNAVTTGSQDYQYPAFQSVVTGENPYTDFLDHPEHFPRAQKPNYLPQFYLAFSPLGALPSHQAQWAWAILNILFGAAIPFLAYRRKVVPRLGHAIFIFCLLFISTPFRNSLGNGQMGIFVTFALAVALVWPRGTAVAFGAALTKWTMAIPFGLLLPSGRFWRMVGVVILLQAGAFLGLDLVTGAPLGGSLAALWEVYQGQGNFSGQGLVDWQSVGRYGLPGWMGYLWLAIYALPLVLLAITRWRKPWTAEVVVLVTMASLGIVYHRGYDFVLLILPLLWIDPRQWKRHLALGAVIFMSFFAIRIGLALGLELMFEMAFFYLFTLVYLRYAWLVLGPVGKKKVGPGLEKQP